MRKTNIDGILGGDKQQWKKLTLRQYICISRVSWWTEEVEGKKIKVDQVMTADKGSWV